MFRIPEGWLKYRPFKKPIDIYSADARLRLLPVKTPLSKSFSASHDNPNGLKHDEEFTPAQFVEDAQRHGFDLGIVIDLTYTDRYYSPAEFLRHGVKHVKIKCPGQEVPSDRTYRQFEQEVQQFTSDHSGKGKVIVVHCTHGVNRTGYLICRYLIEHHEMDVKSALREFRNGRGCDLEKEHYIDALHCLERPLKNKKLYKHKEPRLYEHRHELKGHWNSERKQAERKSGGYSKLTNRESALAHNSRRHGTSFERERSPIDSEKRNCNVPMRAEWLDTDRWDAKRSSRQQGRMKTYRSRWAPYDRHV